MADPGTLVVRDYAGDDLDAVLDLFHRAVHEVAARDYSPAELGAWAPDEPDRTAWAARLGAGGVFVAEDDGTIAGIARVDDAGHVDLLYVHPAHLRRGVATALMARMIAWAGRHGAHGLCADVSLTARLFFERSGFRVTARQAVERRGVQLVNLRMERDLTPPGSTPAGS